MSDLLTTDLCIVGDSAAGLSAALIAAAFGVPTVLVKSGRTVYGADMARHSLRAAANAANDAGQAHRFGLHSGPVTIDGMRVMQIVRDAQARAALRNSTARFKALGVQVIEADATFESTHVLRAGPRRIAARRFIIAVPHETTIPAISTLPDDFVFTRDSIFGLTRWPRHLAIYGTDGEALEFAQAFQRLGVTTHLIVPTPILPEADPEHIGIVRTALRRDGVTFHDATLTGASRGQAQGQVRLMLHADGQSLDPIDVDALLVCGAGPVDTETLGLAAAGVGSSGSGIRVDDRLRTDNPCIFAIGDCAAIGGPSGAHASQAQAETVMRQVLFRLPATYDGDRLPRALSTTPEWAAAGLNEAAARARYGAIAVLRSAFADNDLAYAAHHTTGHVKIVLDRRGRLVGVSLTGPSAAELIGPWARALGQKIGPLRSLVPPSPSFAETPRRALVESLAPLARSKVVRMVSAWLRRFG